MNKTRGRPRQYDADQALSAALDRFWEKGYANTSLDELSSAMDMSRPSIYNAFGDKETIYRLALERFSCQLDQALTETLQSSPNVRLALRRFFAAALAVYYANDPPRGCFIMCTAPVEALAHTDVRDDLRNVLRTIDEALAKRLLAARDVGQISPDIDCRQVARLLQAVLHSLALRARAGESRRALRALADYSVEILLKT